MNDKSLSDWIDQLPSNARQYSIIFLQLGHALIEVRDEVRNLPATHLEVGAYLKAPSAVDSSTVFLYGVEKLADGRGEKLGSLRDNVMRDAKGGRSVALVSRSPKTAFPDTVGSDVVSDAKQVFAPTLGPTAIQKLDDEFYCGCVAELGDRTLMALSDALWDSQFGPPDAIAALSRGNIEALRGSGLAVIESGEAAWHPHGNFKKLRMAVARFSAETIAQRPSVPDTFAELWIVERLIRNVFRRTLLSKMGAGWRESCLDEGVGASVLERAQKDSQPRARKLADLRDPLEWLTTSELFDLRDRHELGSLGLEPHHWTKIRTEVLPIRNRIAHMRIVSDDDVRRVRMWRQLLTERLG